MISPWGFNVLYHVYIGHRCNLCHKNYCIMYTFMVEEEIFVWEGFLCIVVSTSRWIMSWILDKLCFGIFVVLRFCFQWAFELHYSITISLDIRFLTFKVTLYSSGKCKIAGIWVQCLSLVTFRRHFSLIYVGQICRLFVKVPLFVRNLKGS